MSPSMRRSISRRAPRSRTPSASSTNWRNPAAMTAGSRNSRRRSRSRVDMAAKAFQRDGKLSGIATGLRDLDTKMGGLQPSDLIVAGRPSRHGQDRACHQYRLQHRQSLPCPKCRPTARRKLSMAAWSASSPAKCRPNSSPPVSSPSAPAFRRARSAAAASARLISKRSATIRSNCSRCRSLSTKPAASRSRNSPRAPAG